MSSCERASSWRRHARSHADGRRSISGLQPSGSVRDRLQGTL